MTDDVALLPDYKAAFDDFNNSRAPDYVKDPDNIRSCLSCPQSEPVAVEELILAIENWATDMGADVSAKDEEVLRGIISRNLLKGGV